MEEAELTRLSLAPHFDAVFFPIRFGLGEYFLIAWCLILSTERFFGGNR